MLKTLIIIILITEIKAARILAVSPAPFYSHHLVYNPYFKELARRGHELVLLTTQPTNDSKIEEISWDEYSTLVNFPNVRDITMDLSLCGSRQTYRYMELITEINSFQLGDEKVQALINNQTEHFDLIIFEVLNSVMSAFKHRFNAPLLGIVPMDLYNVYHNYVGNEVHHILYPNRIFAYLGDNMPFLCRFITVVGNTIIDLFIDRLHYGTNENIKKYFGKNYPPVQDLEKTVDMLFMSANPAFFKPRPTTQAAVNIYGLHIKKTKPLPKDLKQYLDESKLGVIYFSLGTHVNHNFLSIELLSGIKKVFSELPYEILWKFDNETMVDKPRNVLIKKWIPQQDTLAHPNIKLFITHCGLQSLEEGLHHQVPMLGIPIMCDQWINCGYLEKRGFGLALDYRKFKYTDFKNAILNIMRNLTSHKANLKKWSDIVLDTPNTSMERAIFWTEYVIRHNGSQHLKGTNDLPFYQYYYLDVISCLIAILLVFIFITYTILKFLIKSCFRSKQSKTKTN